MSGLTAGSKDFIDVTTSRLPIVFAFVLSLAFIPLLIDATIIRGVLLPATMKLLGARNWYLPKGLGWLPKFKHEPETAPAPA